MTLYSFLQTPLTNPSVVIILISGLLLSILLAKVMHRMKINNSMKKKVAWKRNADLIIWAAIFYEGDHQRGVSDDFFTPAGPKVKRWIHNPSFRKYLMDKLNNEINNYEGSAANKLNRLYLQLQDKIDPR